VLISPEELRVPSYVKNEITKSGKEYYETKDLVGAMPELDILYMTRIQKERFFSEEEYLRLKDSYILDPEKLTNAKSDLSIMHPLPRVNEISVKVDSDPRAHYFEQALNGKYMRMALILKLLGLSGDNINNEEKNEASLIKNEIICKNPRCITSCEQELEHIFVKTENGECRCLYCESKAK
jgi:aspartate carbamoyltransferase catalytic subunit